MTEQKPIVHMIGHGHIDPVWGWRWMEGCEEVRATFRSAIQLMKEYPDYKFIASSAAFYEWVRELEPELFEEIREAVKNKRWEIVGGWWVEPDCNIPHGESFVRHGLYSQRFFQKYFGDRAKVGFNPDSFGHAGILPQILSRQGMSSYCYLRPNAGHWEMDYPNVTGTVFHWKSPDGSSIIGANIPCSYGSWQFEIFPDIRRHTTWKYLMPGQPDLLSFYGIGNHGGGPSRMNIETLMQAQKEYTDLDIRFSSLRDFFAAIQEKISDKLPVIDYDLQHHAVGCYSVVSMMKKINRLAEHALMRSERLSTIESLMSGRSPQAEKYEELWRIVLFNQFHDILAGSSIPQAYEDVYHSQGKAIYEAELLEDCAHQRIAAQIDTSEEGRTIVVFNPSPWDRTEYVMATEERFFEFDTKDRPWAIELLDDTGQEIPHEKRLAYDPGQPSRCFIATVPAMGYRTYSAREIKEMPRHAEIRANAGLKGTLEVGLNFIENDFWRIEVHPTEGYLSRLYDKRNDVEVLDRGYDFVALADSSDTWSHGVRGYKAEMARFSHAKINPVKKTDISVSLQVSSEYNKSHQQTTITLYRGLATIDIKTRLFWQEKFICLKLGFETSLENTKAIAESAYSHDARPTRHYEEWPCHGWVDLAGTARTGDGKQIPYGLAVLNDSHYGFDARQSNLRMTILRCPPFRYHDPTPLRNEDGWAFTDQGEHNFRYRLMPHAGCWKGTDLHRAVWELNEPLYAHQESSHPGRLPRAASFLRVDNPHVVLTVLKSAEEDADAVVMRLVETHGEAAEANIEMPWFGKSWKFLIGPYEIVTLKVNKKTWSLEEMDLLEEPAGALIGASRK